MLPASPVKIHKLTLERNRLSCLEWLRHHLSIGAVQVKKWKHFASKTAQKTMFPYLGGRLWRKNLTQIQNHYNCTMLMRNSTVIKDCSPWKWREKGIKKCVLVGMFTTFQRFLHVWVKNSHNLKMVLSSQTSNWSNVIIMKINISRSI